MEVGYEVSSGNYWISDPGAFYIAAMLKSNFGIDEQEVYRQAANAYDNCFMLIKQSKISESLEAYEKCCEINKKTDPILLDWIMAFYGQRLCFYYYKTKNFEKAINLTKKIIDSVQFLQQIGHRFLFFGGIQQRLNLSRIYFKISEVKLAISLCKECMIDLYHPVGFFDSDKVIDGVSEKVLMSVAHYGMIVEVLSETCNRLLFVFQSETEKLGIWLSYFLEPLVELKYTYTSSDQKYMCIDKFILLMSGLSGYRDLQDDDILFFLENSYADKKLLMCLNNYIKNICIETDFDKK